MPDPTPTPTPTSTPASIPTAFLAVDHLKQILALIEQLPQLVTDVTALVAELKQHDLAGALKKLQEIMAELKTVLS